MKPKTKLERQMVAMAEKLPAITERQRQYAFDHCFARRAVYRRRSRQVRCLCCGQSTVWPKEFIESFIDVEQYDCPHCNKTTTIEDHISTTEYLERKFFTILTTFRGHQVARTFEVVRDNSGVRTSASYYIGEVFQNWLLPDGKEVITGRRCHRSPFSLSWDFHLPLEIRHHNASATGAYQMEDLYDICGNTLYPDVRVTPLIRRNGWTRQLLRYCNMISMVDAMRWLLTVPTAEMLVKTRQLDLFLHLVRGQNRIHPFLHAVRIANRNGYIVTDAQMWLDMLRMAGSLRLDTHNPRLVCPPDLVEAHNAILARYTRRQARLKRENELAEAAKWEETYRQAKGRYFGISFGNADIIIAVAGSVAEIAEEGQAMHHCVYAAGYHKKPDSLILTARDHAGNRLETIEVSLRTFQVLQSRAAFNGTSPRHAEILALMNANMHLIRRASA